MQKNIIDLLFENRGIFISGKQLAEIMNISTVAVWKRIQRLIREGYEIEALRKKGYRLASKPTRLWPSGYNIPETKWLAKEILFKRSVSSTMDLAKQAYKSGKNVIALAREQTAGRGRRKKVWLSEADKGIYMTIVVRPDFPAKLLGLINLATSVVISKLLKEHYGIFTKIKWPNDIFFNGKKICGILIEAETEGSDLTYLAVGIGIDLYDNRIYGSLSESKIYINPMEFVSLIVKKLDIGFENIIIGVDSLLSYWRLNNNTLGKRVAINTPGGLVSGIAKEIDKNGYLIVDSDGKFSKVISGEVILKDADE